MLSHDECRKVFDTYMNMSVTVEQQETRLMTEQLTEDELEQAALRSYAYFVAKLQYRELLSKEICFATAMREAHRHLEGVCHVETALNLLRATLKFHQQNKTHLFKTCMQEDFEYDNEEDANLAKIRRDRLIRENRDVQAMIIRGQDRQKNAVWVAMPRKQPGDDPQAFVDVLIYTIERCTAATEASTLGARDKMIAVLDCKQSASPSVKAIKMGITILQAHYPGRLANLIVLDLNYILQGLYNCVKPFLDPGTLGKFIVVKGTKAKEAALSVHIEEDQAQTNLLENGKLSPIVDGEWFVKGVPFPRLYDYVSPKDSSFAVAPAHEPHAARKDYTKIPTSIKSPRRFKTKSRTLAVGTVAGCLTRVSVTVAA